MVVTRRKQPILTMQERLAKEDIRLLLDCIRLAKEDLGLTATPTRIELLIGKLKRMEQQK